jgi:hypothetical protein
MDRCEKLHVRFRRRTFKRSLFSTQRESQLVLVKPVDLYDILTMSSFILSFKKCQHEDTVCTTEISDRLRIRQYPYNRLREGIDCSSRIDKTLE